MTQGAIGELLIKGPNITPGYWNKPEATAAAFTDGWLHTGDAARLDDEGFVYIVDRWKDMYISGGENVYPAEVENVLFQLPQVADAAIIGVPNERWGEVGMAIIVRKPDQALEEGDVIRHCLGRLAKFKVPQSVTFVDVLPRNATGKVLKRELRTQFVGTTAPAISCNGLASAMPSSRMAGDGVRRQYLNQRHVVVLADALHDQEGERALAGIGHQVRPAWPRR